MRSLLALLLVVLTSNALAQTNGGPTPSPTPTPRPSPTPTPTPAPTPRPSPTPPPPPPGTPPPQFARWQANMLTFGSQHCLASSRGTEDERLGATYYDAIQVYEQIRAYTGNAAQWDPCIASAVATYRGYVEGSAAWDGGYGAVPGYWNFTSGLRRHFERTGDVRSKQAVIELARNAAYCADWTPPEYTTSAAYSREVAYCLEARLDAMALGAPKTPYYDLRVSTALGHLDQWWVSKSYRPPLDFYDGMPGGAGNYYIQPFMVGLTAHALMREWERSRDSRILPLVKAALDGLWSRAWVAVDQSFWYENFVTSPSLPFPPRPGAPDLNQLIAPAYLLYAKATGDTSYLTKADAIFAGGVVGAWLENPKQFNQSYRWSFDYVKRH